MPCMVESELNSDLAPGGPERFATTHWSTVLLAGRNDSGQAAEALEKLCRAYWYPLYAYVRRQGHDPQAAQDLTQEFFSRLLAGEALKAADPSKGRFRTYLLTLLKRMLVSDWRHEQRQKRGGDAIVFSLDAHAAEEDYQFEPPDPVTPESVFERRWAETVLERVMKSLEAEYRSHALGYENLQPYLVEAKGAVPFAPTAARLGVTERSLKATVYRLRNRYGELFRQEVAHTVERPEEVEEEIRHLLGALRG